MDTPAVVATRCTAARRPEGACLATVGLDMVARRAILRSAWGVVVVAGVCGR